MTISKARPSAKPGTIPDFLPVPRHYNRHDGWTEERQRGFIAALADTGSVKAAAHRVNMTPEGAYLLRRHPAADSFRQAWEAALALGVQQLEDIAMERALYGQEVPVYSYGKLIGSRIVHNDRLLMFMLRNRAPTRFSADGRVTARRATIGDPAEANRLSRLKKQWRKEWEEARRREDESNEAEIYAQIDAKLDKMAQQTRAAMPPAPAPSTKRGRPRWRKMPLRGSRRGRKWRRMRVAGKLSAQLQEARTQHSKP